MSLLNQLSAFPKSSHKIKRLGRGKSSGHGGTSTKGHKGQRARSGFGLLRGFEGGQMPLVRLLPKFGFTNARFKTKYNIINVSDLNRFDSEVDPSILYKEGLVKKNALVKILAQGKLKKSLKVKAHCFSKKATEVIKKAGGQVEELLSFSVSEVIPASDSVGKDVKPEESVAVSTETTVPDSVNEEKNSDQNKEQNAIDNEQPEDKS